MAQALQWEGEKTQGSLLIGRVEPGTKVRYDDRYLRVSPEGVFIIGFGRSAPLKQTVTLVRDDGVESVHTLELAKRDYEIQRIDGLPSKKVSPPKEAWDRIAKEVKLLRGTRESNAPRTDFLGGFIRPVTGTVSGVFGSRRILNDVPKRPHYGLDIAAAEGTPVKAPAAGVVTLTHPGMFYTGGTIVLDHGHGLTSIYIHLSGIDVEEGARVEQGEVIGAVGATGRATGPHLHWGVYWFKLAVDPRLLLDMGRVKSEE